MASYVKNVFRDLLGYYVIRGAKFPKVPFLALPENAFGGVGGYFRIAYVILALPNLSRKIEILESAQTAPLDRKSSSKEAVSRNLRLIGPLLKDP